MSEIACTATMSTEAIEINLDGNTISISLEGDIDFTNLVKHLTNLIEQESSIEITWTESEEATTDKENVARGVINEVIDSFNKVIEEEFDEKDEGDDDNPF